MILGSSQPSLGCWENQGLLSDYHVESYILFVSLYKEIIWVLKSVVFFFSFLLFFVLFWGIFPVASILFRFQNFNIFFLSFTVAKWRTCWSPVFQCYKPCQFLSCWVMHLNFLNFSNRWWISGFFFEFFPFGRLSVYPQNYIFHIFLILLVIGLGLLICDDYSL